MTPEEFKQHRKTLDLSQRALAEVLGQNYRSIQRYEIGRWPVPVKVAEKVKSLIKEVGRHSISDTDTCKTIL